MGSKHTATAATFHLLTCLAASLLSRDFTIFYPLRWPGSLGPYIHHTLATAPGAFCFALKVEVSIPPLPGGWGGVDMFEDPPWMPKPWMAPNITYTVPPIHTYSLTYKLGTGGV